MKFDITQTQTCFFMIFSGILCAAAGAMLLCRRKLKLTNLTIPVTAQVTDVLKEERTVWKEDNDGTKLSHTRIVYTPILEYEVGGKTYRGSHSSSGSAGRIGVGAAIEIFCNPDNPLEIRYRNAQGLLVSIVTIVLGCGLALIGMILLCK